MLEPHQKGETAPHQLSSCSFSPLLRPRSSARLFIYPSACSASSRFRLALSAQSSSPLLRTTSALAPSPRVLGSSQRSPFYHAPAPFRTLAFSAPLSRLSFPLLRLPRARFSALPLHIPQPVFHARSLGVPRKPPVASAIQSPRSLLFLAYLLHAIYCFLAIIWQILDGNSAAIAIFLTGIWQNITPGKSQKNITRNHTVPVLWCFPWRSSSMAYRHWIATAR